MIPMEPRDLHLHQSWILIVGLIKWFLSHHLFNQEVQQQLSDQIMLCCILEQ